MILEVAILNVRTGESSAFETAFDEAKAIISTMPGFDHLELQRCLETPDRYVLLVRWDTLEGSHRGLSRITRVSALEGTAAPLL